MRLIDKHISKSLLNLPQLSRFLHDISDQNLQSNFFDVDDSLKEQFEFIFEVVVENQRGFKVFGLPFFSGNGLLPIVDPSSFQYINGVKLRLVSDNLNNLPLPDLNWVWHWPKWYILMLDDVDDQGWIYAKMLFRSHHWKGKYYFGNFVRRRVWIRLRKRSLNCFCEEVKYDEIT